MQDGLYDLLIDSDIKEALAAARFVEIENPVGIQLDEYLAARLKKLILDRLSLLESSEAKVEFLNSALAHLSLGSHIPENAVLRAVISSEFGQQSKISTKPEIPLGELALLTNAKGEPSMGPELRAELFSADRVDVLMAFIRLSGLRAFYEPLRELKKRQVPVRVITSAYLGATEKKAIDQLVSELGAEVRIDYLARANRLHAKAWLIHRESGFTTAYVGSSNISDPALTSGLEWNVKLSQDRAPEILDKFRAAFDSYWNSDDFAGYLPEIDGEKLEEALQRGKGRVDQNSTLTLSGLEVRPLPHQIQMLEELEVEREYNGFHRNLVVAATGSGKTVLAALDYKKFAEKLGRLPTLLFVAHREEILIQSRKTFAEVMRDSSLGELLVNGQKPKNWLQVFASIQSLKNLELSELGKNKFDYIVIDEFHHADAPSYRKILDFFEPIELLGLTATPERTNGVMVQNEFFGGRIASELRLWDALDQELLTPFHYFGIGESTDFSELDWSAGSYKQSELSNLVTANTFRDRLMFDELNRKVSDLNSMKALFFCVDVKHAEYVAELLNKHGINTECVVGSTPGDIREKSIKDFRNGKLQALTSVDVFNEGFDVPEIDTVVMLRPTESPLLFLQQLGRGLRKAANKSEVLVMDFIGAHRAEYRLDLKFAAMIGRSRTSLKHEVEAGFPFLPSGVVIALDELARNQVLRNIRDQIDPSRKSLVREVRAFEPENLADFITKAGRELWEIFGKGEGWLSLRAAADGDEKYLADYRQSRIKNFLHINDPHRFAAYKRFLTQSLTPWEHVDDFERRTRYMFFWQIWEKGLDKNGLPWDSVDAAIESLQKLPQFKQELLDVLNFLESTSRNLVHHVEFRVQQIPLFAHANYSRLEILGAIGAGPLEKSPLDLWEGDRGKQQTKSHREGVIYKPELELDFLFVTLNKGHGYSISTRYQDYSETPSVFHWESQSVTSTSSPTGQRYLAQATSMSDIAIAVREQQDGQISAETFRFLGLADFIKSEGEKPIKIWWKLRVPLDPQTFKIAAAVRVA